MLLEGLQDRVAVGERLARRGVQDLFLDRRVHRQLADHLVDEGPLRLVSVLAGPLEPAEELLDGVVILTEQNDAVLRHGCPPQTLGAPIAPAAPARYPLPR